MAAVTVTVQNNWCQNLDTVAITVTVQNDIQKN